MTDLGSARAPVRLPRLRRALCLVGLLPALACLPPAGAAAGAPEPSGHIERLFELVQRGNDARRMGRLGDAITAYREARDLAPDRYEVRLLLADSLRRAGREGAGAEYDRAVRIDPSRPEAYVGQAMLLRAAFDYPGAAALLEHALQSVAPEARGDLLVSLAETRRRQGRLDQAAGLFTRALESEGAAAPARAGLARVAEERGDLAGALDRWDRYLEAMPGDTAAALRRTELKELRAAIQALRAAAGRAPDADVRSELGRLLALAGDAPGAAEAYRAALKIDPRQVDARRGLAMALRDTGDGGAAAAFRSLLELRPGDGVALYNLVSLARGTGSPDAEESAWIALLEARPDDGFAARAFAGFLDEAGEGAVLRALDRFGAEGPVSIPRLRLRALLLASAQRWPEAAAALHDALLRDPSDPRTLRVATEILYLRPPLLQAIAGMNGREAGAAERSGADVSRHLALQSRLNALAGRRREFLQLARAAAAADPRSAIARSLLAEADLSAGHDAGEALEEMRRAVALDPGRLVGHVDLALALLRAGRPADAAAAARRGLERVPEAAELLSVLGAALMDLADLEGAARAHRDALRADPLDDFGLSRTQYPLVLAALGRQVEARRALVGEVPPIPQALYREAWAFARDASRDRTYNGQDWLSWRSRFRGELPTPQEAYRAIATMLASLGDPYTRLRDPEETTAAHLTRHGARVAIDRLGRNRPHSRTVVTRDLGGGLGYIQLSNLTDPKAVAAVRKALEEMRDKEGLVLDLRGNTGGFTRAADAIGDMLVGPGVQAGVDVGPEGPTPHVTGGEGAITDGELVVLVDGQTASAAERLARTLAAAGRATLVGETTYGKGRYQTSRVLPGGVTVLVSAGEMLDAAGRPIRGGGLKPQIRIERKGADGKREPAGPVDGPAAPGPAAEPSPSDPSHHG